MAISLPSPKPFRTTFAPSRAKASARPSPMPDVDPVTSAVLPLSIPVSLLFALFRVLILHCSNPRTRGQPRFTVATHPAYKTPLTMTNISPILEHRDHDHDRCAADALDHADEI